MMRTSVPMPSNRDRVGPHRPALWGLPTTALLLACSPALAESDGVVPGFGGAFFWSRSIGPDGVVQTEWFGTGLIWLLLLMSVVGIGYLLRLASASARRHIAPPELMERIDEAVRDGKWRKVLALTEQDDSDFGIVVHEAFTEAPKGHQTMVERVQQVSAGLATERFRQLEPLNVLGQVAPMVGLFGTVYGMIVAFGSIVASGGNADPVALAGGIGTALVTTFWGLLVAIPALAGYALLRNRVDALEIEVEVRVLEYLDRLEPQEADVAGDVAT